MRRVAAVDLGTNTVRFLVADPADGPLPFVPLFSDQTITRLGQGLKRTGLLSESAMDRTVTAIARMVEAAADLRPFTLRIAATSAARDAANTDDFSRRIEAAVGVGLTVIDWEDEARMSLAGVGLAVSAGRFVLFDIGGGSTEFIRADRGEVVGAHGTDLGVVRLAETYLSRHPVDPAEYAAMNDEIVRGVAAGLAGAGYVAGDTLVGTAGTVTSLAAVDAGMIDYDPARINGYRLTGARVVDLRRRLCAMTLDERSAFPSLRNGREDLIVPGVAIVEAAMAAAVVDDMVVADYGLREGIILDMLGARK
jgi:exopolyphosphatase/guanosine-5'-triphosphate,3'-diphosphate pyrophosphatase